jgi:hypothetical protein
MKILVIPDTQVAPGSDTRHLKWAGKYAAEKKPDIIVHIGDHWDMPSLSIYDVGKKSFEGRQYTKDIEAGNRGMDEFMAPIIKEQTKQRKRAVNADRKLEGLMSYDDFNLREYGWTVHDYLQPVKLGGIMFCHFFVSGVMGRPVSSARIMVNKKHMSCVMGHVQDRDIFECQRADGKRLLGLFAGIFYQEDQEYLNAQTNESWRGIWMLNEVDDGSCDLMPVSLPFLERKYG